MEIKGACENDILAAAQEVGVALYCFRENDRGRGFKTQLRLNIPASCRTPSGRRKRGLAGDAPYQKLSASPFAPKHGRRSWAVCWHGHRDFMRALFHRAPDAVIKSCLATYRGAEDFEAKFRDTGGVNIGALIMPVSMEESCRCPDHVRYEDGRLGERVEAQSEPMTFEEWREWSARVIAKSQKRGE